MNVSNKAKPYFICQRTCRFRPSLPNWSANVQFDNERLPQAITSPGSFEMSLLKEHGLLYLPHPYVVPGGFFKGEMNGWDSYFIIRGLVDAGKFDLAKGIVENFEFEIQHYGRDPQCQWQPTF